MATVFPVLQSLLVLVLLAAAGVLALGIWRGRPDLGKRAFIGVILTSIVAFVVAGLIALRLMTGLTVPVRILVGGSLLMHLIGAVPLLVAGNWLQTIKAATDKQ